MKPDARHWLCTISLILFSWAAEASLFVPSDLNPGDTYQLMFVSSGVRNATSSDPTEYDAFVQSAADAAGIGGTVVWYSYTSTGGDVSSGGPPESAVRDRLGFFVTNNPDTPIYNLNGDFLAAGIDRTWDGIGSNGLFPVKYDEFGQELGPASFSNRVWTGSTVFGTVGSGLGGHNGKSSIGDATATGGRAISDSIYPDQTYEYHLYGISEVLQVASVPVPATVWLFGSGFIGLLGIARKRTEK